MPAHVLIPPAILAVILLITYGLSRGDAKRRRSQAQSAPPLAHELPYWHLTDDGVLVHTDLSYSCFLRVHGLDTDCRASEALSHVATSLHTILAPLSPGVRLEWLYVNDHDQRGRIDEFLTASPQSGTGALLADEKAQAVLYGEPRRSRLFLVATISGPKNTALRPEFDKQVHEKKLSSVLGLREQLTGGLISAGLSARPLVKSQISELLYECLNPGRHKEVPAPSPRVPVLLDQPTLREQLVFSGVKEGPRTLEIDGQLVRVITLRALPGQTHAALVEHLTLGLKFPCRVSFAVEILDDKEKLERLKRRRDQARVLTHVRARPNQEAMVQAEEIEALIDDILVGGCRLVHIALAVAFSIDARHPEAERLLENHTSDVLRAYAQAEGAQGLIEEYGQLSAWLSTLPAGTGRRSRWHSCTSENATHLFPNWESWTGHESAPLLFENGRGFLLGLNPFDSSLENPNAFIAGSSGAGKSVLANYLLMHLLSQGARALIIDVGGSYRRLIELFDGDYISLSPDTDPALNLFQPKELVLSAAGEVDQMSLDFMLSVLSTLIAGRDRGPLTNEELAVLDRTIRVLYSQGDETPLLEDLFKALRTRSFDDPEDAELARALSRRLRYWLEGPHARVLNRHSNITVTSDLAAFDLAGMAEEVRPAVLLIIAGVIWNLVRSAADTRKVVLFDEVWTLLKDPQSQKLLETLYRTSRKHGCSVLSISQSVTDFTQSSIAPALLQNAATVYLLQHGTDSKDIAEVFRLNPRERAVLDALEKKPWYSEILVLSGQKNHTVARLVLTPLEYWITTTSPADTQYLAKFRAEHPDLPLLDSLQECAATYPRGVANPLTT